jgi:3-deoxy-D-manno-octulosonic-acid transferase
MGPHTFNFLQAAQFAIVAGAASRVADMSAALCAALLLAHDATRLEVARQSALAFSKAHQGALAQTTAAVLALLHQQGADAA